MNRNVTAVLLTVLAIGVYVTWTSPKWDEIKIIQTVNDQYIQAINNANRLIKVRDQVLKDYSALTEEDKARLEKVVPNTVDNIRLIIDLSNVAAQRGLTLRNIKATVSKNSNINTVSQVQTIANPGVPGTPGTLISAAPTVDTVGVSFTVKATYDQFVTLMRDIEASLRVMDITRLSMESSDTGIYDYKVELKTYWLRQQ
jgi:Tfp pilus assembly protein PilO